MPDEIPGRVPPQNLEAEQSTLGSMMLEKSALHKGQTIVKPNDFYRPTHQTICEALIALGSKDEPVDIITLQEELRRRGKLEDCGGTEYLFSLAESVPTAANLEYYANIVAQKASLRRLIAAGTQTVADAYAEREDAAERFMGRAVEITTDHTSRMRRSEEIMSAVWDRFEGYRQGRGSAGIGFGIPSLDRMLYGCGPGELIIIGGRPSQGKSVLLQHLLSNAAMEGKTPLLFTKEMTTEEMIERVACMRARVDTNELRADKASSEAWERLAQATGELANTQFLVDDMPCSLTQLCARSRSAKITDDIGIVLIDYLQLIECDLRAENRDNQLATVTRTLKNLAKELSVPVVVPSHHSRAIERRDRNDREPKLSDLREGGNQEGNADKVLLIHNPLPMDWREGDPLEKRMAMVYVAKHRGGRVGKVPLWFTPQWTRFDDVDPRDLQ